MIKDIMSKKIISGDISNSIKKISSLMKENNIGFIPIKENNKYIGVITDRDICISLSEIKDLNDSIKDYITNDIVFIDVNSSIDDALNIMSENKIKRILVTDNDKYVGVLSISDILNYTDNINIVNTFRTIFFIHDNESNDRAEIDEFYL